MENVGRKRRRTQRRKLLPSGSPMDMAEARREIVNALHIHRSSSWMLSSCDTKQENSLSYNMNMPSSTANTITGSQLYHPLVESVQLPEPIWSTIDPAAALLAASPPLDQFLEFDWPQNNLSSSYAWWLGFLRSLDSGKDGVNQPSKYHCNCQGNVSAAGSAMDRVSLDRNEQSQSPEAYEWLTITTSEDEVELFYLPASPSSC